MRRFVYDIEADGFLDVITKIHCLVLKDRDTKEVFSFADQPGYRPVSVGLQMLMDADLTYGHNIICYDIPALKKVFKSNITGMRAFRDTLIMAKMRWPEIEWADRSGRYSIPPELVGSYSLEAFGYRLGFKKQEHSEWKVWSPAMQRRCETDVEITDLLLDKIEVEPIPEKALQIEHDFQEYIHLQETLGVPFDVQRALELNGPLQERIQTVTQDLRSRVGPRKIVMKTKVKEELFNPGSRQQIIRYLCEKYDWKPEVFTDKGNPSLNEDVLKNLPYEEAPLFFEYFQTQKLLGMLSTGENSWLKLVTPDQRLHGAVDTLGTITHRCSHFRPNLGQIPSVRSFMGKEVRSLFYAPEGFDMVGADASGLELRMMAHYLFPYDGGAYGKEVVEGDVHSLNQKVAEIATRDAAKTFIYALIYGGGDETLGEIKIPFGFADMKRMEGRRMRMLFRQKIPAYGELVDAVKRVLDSRPHLIGIDGRILTVRKKYSALNTLLQNAGSVAMKNATVISWKNASKKGIEFYPALHIHDEWQSLAKKGDSEELGKIKVQSIRDSGEDLGFKIRLDGEYKIGANWAETH